MLIPRRLYWPYASLLAAGILVPVSIDELLRRQEEKQWRESASDAVARRASAIAAELAGARSRIDAAASAIEKGSVDAASFAAATATLVRDGAAFAYAPVAAGHPGAVVIANPARGLVRPGTSVERLLGQDTLAAAMRSRAPVVARRGVSPESESFVAVLVRALRPSGRDGPEAVSGLLIEAVAWSTMMERAAARSPLAAIDVWVHDGASGRPELLYFHSSRPAGSRGPREASAAFARELDFGGRQLMAGFAVAAQQPRGNGFRFQAIAVGLSVSFGLAWLLWRPQTTPATESTEPLDAVAPPAAVSMPAAPPPPVESLSGTRVLIAEDNPTNQLVARRLVERLGCAAIVVNNGQEAVDAVQRERFDIVLMDCQMPVLDGFQATAAIRNLDVSNSRIPIIAVTANVLPDDRKTCIEAGMDDYVPKPIDKAVLGGALRQWVAVSMQRRAFQQSATI